MTGQTLCLSCVMMVGQREKRKKKITNWPNQISSVTNISVIENVRSRFYLTQKKVRKVESSNIEIIKWAEKKLITFDNAYW